MYAIRSYYVAAGDVLALVRGQGEERGGIDPLPAREALASLAEVPFGVEGDLGGRSGEDLLLAALGLAHVQDLDRDAARRAVV